MDKSFLGGIIAGIGLLITSIVLAGPLTAFIDAPSLVIVLGGTVASIFIAYPADAVMACVKMTKSLMKKNSFEVKDTIDLLIKHSEAVKKNGKMELEKIKVEDPFLKKGIAFILDNKKEDVLKQLLEQEREALLETEMQSKAIMEKMGDYAPAWGMVGTLIGLVIMMLNLSDPSSIGPSMAIALITTFYGAVFANLFFGPISGKIENLANENFTMRAILIEGVLSLAREEGPRFTEDRLMTFVYHDRKYRKQLEKELKKGA